MGRNREIEEELIKELATRVHDYDFINYALNHMDSTSKKKELLMWLKNNQNATKKEIEWQMFYITTGIKL